MSSDQTTSTPQPSDWWGEAHFGLFIHWGVYSAAAGVHRGRPIAGASEWLMLSAHIPVADYKPYAAGFTAANYDADSPDANRSPSRSPTALTTSRRPSPSPPQTPAR